MEAVELVVVEQVVVVVGVVADIVLVTAPGQVVEF